MNSQLFDKAHELTCWSLTSTNVAPNGGLRYEHVCGGTRGLHLKLSDFVVVIGTSFLHRGLVRNKKAALCVAESCQIQYLGIYR